MVRSSDALCNGCKSTIFNVSSFPNLFVKNDGSYETGGIWISKSVTALSNDCSFCHLIDLTITASTQVGMDSQNFRVHVYAVAPEELEEWDASTLFLDAGSHGCTRYEIFADDDDPAASEISGRVPDPIVDSPRTFRLGAKWMNDCINTHEGCHSLSTRLPTRVLDISPENGDVEVNLFISHGMQAPYATLSYCWGAPQPAMTTRSLLPGYLRCIKVSLLPQTIQDAIVVVRGIGLRYLWVDSLCIIQDSDDDKSFGIQNMGNVYRNAQVCILAAAAKTANDGFLRRPSLPESTLYEFPYFGHHGQVGTMKLRSWNSYTERDLESDPTNRRAWIFQERVLSPRVLIFPRAPHPLEWRCHSASHSNGGSTASASLLDTPRLTAELFEHKPILEPSYDARLTSNETTHWKLWSSLLMNYTRRDMTDNADKLPAMSAVAAEFGRFWNATYIAGLWSHRIVQSLLWKYYPDRTVASQSADRQGPSWSWASTDEGVINVFTKDDTVIHPYHFEFIDCQTTAINALVPFGGVKHGLLIVNALLKPAYWAMPVRVSPLLDAENRTLSVGQGFLDMSRLQGSPEVWCMPLVDASRYESYISSGLVMQKKNNGQFERIGVFNLAKLDWFEDCQQRRIEIV